MRNGTLAVDRALQVEVGKGNALPSRAGGGGEAPKDLRGGLDRPRGGSGGGAAGGVVVSFLGRRGRFGDFGFGGLGGEMGAGIGGGFFWRLGLGWRGTRDGLGGWLPVLSSRVLIHTSPDHRGPPGRGTVRLHRHL